jgi:hypothetical protein
MSENIDKIIEDLARQEFVVFAGAGIPNGDGKAISWRELLAAFKDAEPDLVVQDVKEVLESEYPDYAQKVFDALRCAQREDRYHEILREKLRATNARCSSQQRDIIETARHVVTTNFDDSFKDAMERELEGKNDTGATQSLPNLQLRTLNTRNTSFSVSYLHGITNEECIVFKTEDYNTFYPSQSGSNGGNDNLEQFLRHLYEEQTIVFVGVSFNDKYLLKAIEIFCDQVKRNDEVGSKKKVSYKSNLGNIQHYAFMPDDMGIEAGEMRRDKDYNISEQQQLIKEERKRKRELLGELKIKVVTYQEHLEWPDWFTTIREKRRKHQQGKAGVFEDPSKDKH